MHSLALILGIVLLVVGLGLLIWGIVRKHNKDLAVSESGVTLGLLIGGGVSMLIGIILIIVGALHKKEVEVHIEPPNSGLQHLH